MGIENIQIIETVSLDFYNNNIKTINVKQMDTDARGVKINCTEHGKKFKLDPLSHSAFVRYKKPDGYDVFNDCYIQNDGSVVFALTQQMTAVAGKSKLDILIFCSSGLTVDSIGDISSFNDLGIATLSTMALELNNYPNATDLSQVESSYEYNALIEGLSKMVAVDNRMSTLEQTINENETQRQEKEIKRQEAEVIREQILEETKTVLEQTKTAIEEAQQATSEAEIVTENANTVIENANTATDNANTATANANNAANEVRDVLYNGGIVLKTDIIHDFETEDENKIPDATQVKLLKEMIDGLQTQLETVHKVYYGTEEPTSDIGRDGDIYMMLIEE